MGKWWVPSTRAYNVLKMFSLVSRPPHPQCLKDSYMTPPSTKGLSSDMIFTPIVIVMTFWYVFWNGLTFFELFKLLFSLGIDHNPPCSLCSHDLCLFISLCFSSHNHMAKRSHYRIMIFSTSEYYSMDASPPSFSSISSTTPPPLYSPSMSTYDGPT